mgnify:CR=1 FL=1
MALQKEKSKEKEIDSLPIFFINFESGNSQHIYAKPTLISKASSKT